ncbi:unnamed protein product [Caenorhabditis bovis]|uniref:Uncharacterized protein n=1 Tax=Caenorhabditis bovis TaxID=2654633 RepID=A0A8S1ESN1_9PELO|nr:unnamed protein product [Caenorhabditis bovis]
MPMVIELNLTKEEAKKKFVLSEIEDTMTVKFYSKDAKRGIIYCNTCHDVIPIISSPKYTPQRAKEAHLDSPFHRRCAEIIESIKQMDNEKIYMSEFQEHNDFKWRQAPDGVWYLNEPVGLKYGCNNETEKICTLCFCYVDSKEHFSSEAHVVNYTSKRKPYEMFFVKQMIGDERREGCIKLLSNEYIGNDFDHKVLINRFPSHIQNLLCGDTRSYMDVAPEIINNYNARSIFCPICNSVFPYNGNGELTAEECKLAYMKHIYEIGHFETLARRGTYTFNDEYFAPYPPTVTKMAVTPKLRWEYVKDTDMLIQTLCDVGLEYVVEDDDHDEVVCTLCVRKYSRSEPTVLNYHVRSLNHIKQYLNVINRNTIDLIATKSDEERNDILKFWLEKNSASFAKDFKVYSKKKCLQLSDWKDVPSRIINYTPFSQSVDRDVFDTLSDIIDKISCDGVESATISAHDALIGNNVKIIRNIANNLGNIIEAVCRCMSCELVFHVHLPDWIPDVFQKHLWTEEHLIRYENFEANRYDEYGISDERSTYTVKEFEQKDPTKKVTWQWNSTKKLHEYVRSVVGLQDIIEKREYVDNKLNAEFFCTLCAKMIPKRAALLESHVREAKHLVNFMHKYHPLKVREFEILGRVQDKGKEQRKFLTDLLKDVRPPTAYCIRIYDPAGKAEKEKIAAEQKKLEETRAMERMAAREKALEDRKNRIAELEKKRLEQIKYAAEKNHQLEMERRKREEEREARIKLALERAQRDKALIQNGPDLSQKIDIAKHVEQAHLLRARTTEKMRLEEERKEIEERIKALNPPKLIIPGNLAPKTAPLTNFTGVPRPLNPPPMPQWNGPPVGVPPPPIAYGYPGMHGFNGVHPVPPPSVMTHIPPPPLQNIVPHMPVPPPAVAQLTPAYIRRPSLKDRNVDPFLFGDKVSTKHDVMEYLMKKGAERIPTNELPEEFSRTANEIPGALGIDSIYEVVCIDDEKLTSYFCTLCAEWNSAKEMMKHVVSENHTMGYLFRNYKNYYATVKNEKDKGIRRAILKNFSKDVQKMEQGEHKVEHRMHAVLSKKVFVNAWPGYEKYFFDAAQWKTSGFQEINYEPVPVPAPISKSALILDDDDDEDDQRSKHGKSSKKHREKRRRSHSRSRKRSRSKSRTPRSSRSRSRSRSRDRRRRRSKSRSSSWDKHRSSKNQSSSSKNWAAETDAFLAKLSSGKSSGRSERSSNHRDPLRGNSSTEEKTDDKSFAEKIAQLRNLTKTGAVKGSEIDEYEEKRKLEAAKREDILRAEKEIEKRRIGSKQLSEDDKTKQRKMLGVIITMQQQVERGEPVDKKRIEELYREVGLNAGDGEELLRKLTSGLPAVPKPAPLSIDFASYSIAPTTSGTSAYKAAVQSTLSSTSTQHNYNQPGVSSSSSYQNPAYRFDNLKRMAPSQSAQGSTSSILPPSYYEKQSQEIFKDSVSHVYPETTQPVVKKAKEISADDDSDDEYLEIMSLIGKKPSTKDGSSSQNSTTSTPQKMDVKPTICPGQKMALARTVLPNGQKVKVENPAEIGTLVSNPQSTSNQNIAIPGANQVHQPMVPQNMQQFSNPPPPHIMMQQQYGMPPHPMGYQMQPQPQQMYTMTQPPPNMMPSHYPPGIIENQQYMPQPPPGMYMQQHMIPPPQPGLPTYAPPPNFQHQQYY